MSRAIQFKTFEKQRQALRFLRDSVTNEVLYGGGARCGKSYLGCAWILLECFAKPGSSWMIAREELTKLRDTTLVSFFKVLKDWGLEHGKDYYYNAQSFVFRLSNGSTIFFREIKYLPSDPEFDRLGSYDLTGAFLDEAQQITKKAIDVLRGRFSVLQGEAWQTIPKMLFTCNPSKNWIYSDFVKPFISGSLAKNKVFIKSLATDNPFVSQEYIDFLKTSDPVTVQRLLYGNFEYDDDPRSLIQYDNIIDSIKDYKQPQRITHISADIARYGDDMSVVVLWDGWDAYIYEYAKKGVDVMANVIGAFAKDFGVPRSRIIIDDDGVGGGVTDLLKCVGFNNGSKAIPQKRNSDGKWIPENYTNLKSQCYFLFAEMINLNSINIFAKHKDSLSEEMEQIKRAIDDVDVKKLSIISKDEVKKNIGRSPDRTDALMMRMYFELKQVAKFADANY